MHPARHYFFVLMLLLLPIGCLNVGDKTYEEVEPSDIPATVSYSSHVSVILSNRCLECHSPSGRFGIQGKMDFSDYQLAKANFSGIEKTVFQDKIMPPGTKEKPTSREITILQKWQTQGFQP